MKGLLRILNSSKVLLAIAGILAILGAQYLGFTPEVAGELADKVVVIIIALMGTIAGEDIAKKLAAWGAAKKEAEPAGSESEPGEKEDT